MGGRARRSMAVVMVLALGVLSACGGGGGNKVDATLSDFKVTLAQSDADAGEVTFSIKNDGPSVHEFVIFKTDLAPDQLPMTEDEDGIPIVDEEGAGVEHIDEVEDVASGSTEELKATLAAGKYVLICNLPAHYQQGMHAPLTVTG